MSGPPPIEHLADLPTLWSTEARETADLVLPLRFMCRWHALRWYPVERDGDILFGFTTRVVPEWRHFDISELLGRYRAEPVLLDRAHAPVPAPEVTEIADAHLLDISPFWPSRPGSP